MSTSSQGIAGKATLFTGVVCPRFITVTLLDDKCKPISNVKCEVTFEEGDETVTVEITSDGQGVLKFQRKASGKFTVKLLD